VPDAVEDLVFGSHLHKHITMLPYTDHLWRINKSHFTPRVNRFEHIHTSTYFTIS